MVYTIYTLKFTRYLHGNFLYRVHGRWRKCCTTKEMRKALNAAVLGEYQKAVEKPSVRGALQEATKESAARPTPDAPKADKSAR